MQYLKLILKLKSGEFRTDTSKCRCCGGRRVLVGTTLNTIAALLYLELSRPLILCCKNVWRTWIWLKLQPCKNTYRFFLPSQTSLKPHIWCTRKTKLWNLNSLHWEYRKRWLTFLHFSLTHNLSLSIQSFCRVRLPPTGFNSNRQLQPPTDTDAAHATALRLKTTSTWEKYCHPCEKRTSWVL